MSLRMKLNILTAMNLMTALVGLRLPTASHVEEAPFDKFGIVLTKRNPSNFKCEHLPSEVREDWADYAQLLKTGSGKRIRLIGDSTLEQVFTIINCAAKSLGQKPLQMEFIKFYGFKGLPGHEHISGSNSLPLRTITANNDKYDHTFVNFGHHDLHEMSADWGTFENVVTSIFKESKQNLGKNANVTFLGHWAGHFKTGHGGYEPEAKSCSCNLAHWTEQPVIEASQIAEKKAGEYGLNFISIWQDFADKCDMHRGFPDCFHMKLYPLVFAPVIRKIEAALRSSAMNSTQL